MSRPSHPAPRRPRRRWAAAAAGTLAVGLVAPLSLGTTVGLAGSAGAALPAAAPEGSVPVPDPIPEKPAYANLGLVLEEYAQLPETDPTPLPTDQRLLRHNRINFVGEVPDDSGRLYVPDLNGPLYLLRDGEEQLYLDVKTEFADFFSGRGLGSGFGFVSFDPEFGDNGRFYTVHTERGSDLPAPDFDPQSSTFSHSVVTEWTADDPAADTFSGTHREVLRIAYATQIHATQQIDFNPYAEPDDEDYGLLYVASGDGGIGLRNDEPQTLDNPYGKLLRIDPDGTGGAGDYGVPASNPFVGQGGALGEIYSYGYRDPHRFSWDPKEQGGTHTLYVGNIGQHQIEGVYEVRPGDNAGWSDLEGRFLYDNADECNLYTVPDDYDTSGITFPVAEFDHDPPAGHPCSADSGHGMSAGQVYRGTLPGLAGKYVFGDLVDGRVFWAQASQMHQERPETAPLHLMQLWLDGERLTAQQLVDDERVDLRFGTDSDGTLYLLAKATGQIWKVVGTRHEPVHDTVVASLRDDVVSRYDFEHPFAADGSKELDQGDAEQLLSLVNGGEDMRVDDSAFPGSRTALQTRQVSPEVESNDDWKAGAWDEDGLASLERFAGADAATVMGWFKVTDGDLPALNSRTPDPTDRFNAVGLAGVLSGNSDGHGVRALLEIIQVDGELKVVALGRRIDTGSSSTYAADMDWRDVLPVGEWVHLAATFDYTTGEMALYRNGEPLSGFYTSTGDPWAVDGTGTSDTLPRGYKIGGSYPQDTREQNPCGCRMDELTFLDTAATPQEVKQQYRRYTSGR